MLHKSKITLTIILILLSALLWAVRPQPAQAMRRESLEPDLIIQPTDLVQALDMSLSLGDGRRVNWQAIGWEA